MKQWAWMSAWLLGACVVNGQPVGPMAPSSNPPPPAASGQAQQAGQPSGQGEALPRGYVYDQDGRAVYSSNAATPDDERYFTEPAYSTAPADPWAAVVGDQPRRWPAEAAKSWRATQAETLCTARVDHCLVSDTWFFVDPAQLERQARVPNATVGAAVAVFGPAGPAVPWNARSPIRGQNLIAYRTVPATRANLVVGGLVIGHPRTKGRTLPYSGISAAEEQWVFGTLESVEYDLGVYRVKGYMDTLPLEGARVAVLEWREGGRVEILGGRRRDQLAVRASDVFMPPAP